MQPSIRTSKLRPILGVVALCAVAAAAYFLMSPDKPLVLAPDAMATVTPPPTALPASLATARGP